MENIWKKGIVCTIIMLFLCSGIIPSISGSQSEDTAKNSEVILETSFEEEWVLDSDGDYYAPPGWDVDGICVGGFDEIISDCTHYWNDLHEGDEHGCSINVSHNGNTSANVWWSNGNNETVGLNQSEWLISPEFDFSNYSQLELKFWSVYSWSEKYDHCCWVKISTDGGFTFENIVNLVNDSDWYKGGEIIDTTNWFEYPVILNLSEYAGKSSVRIAWHYYFNNETGISRTPWWVDDVTFTGVPEINEEEEGNGEPSGVTPGFELVLAFLAIAMVCLILLRRKSGNE